MKNHIDTPKVFISYSWSSPEHEQWVLELAEKLMSDGVHMILDKWDLKEGHDKYAFMEKMVTDPDVKKVLIICDTEYQKKADSRKGGVGAESQIVSYEIYNKVNQEKFIPIVAEVDEKGEPFLPIYLKSRIYIDLSSDVSFYSEYEKLLRNIFDRPLLLKPPLGKPPQHLFEDVPHVLITQHKLSAFKDSIIKGSKHANIIGDEYLEELLTAFEDFRIDSSDESEVPFDDKTVDSITKFMPYRNEFVEYIKILCLYSKENDYWEKIFSFFERSISLMYPPAGVTTWQDRWFDNYRFILLELFIYLISLLIKYKRYDEIDLLLDEHYYYSTNLGRGSTSYAVFGHPIDTLDHARNKRLQLRRVSVSGELMKERSNLKEIPLNDIAQTDVILLLRSVLPDNPPDDGSWFPVTLPYASRGAENCLDIFYKAESKRHFETVKRLLKIKDKNDLVTRFKRADERYGLDRESASWDKPKLYILINLEKLDTI